MSIGRPICQYPEVYAVSMSMGLICLQQAADVSPDLVISESVSMDGNGLLIVMARFYPLISEVWQYFWSIFISLTGVYVREEIWAWPSPEAYWIRDLVVYGANRVTGITSNAPRIPVCGI